MNVTSEMFRRLFVVTPEKCTLKVLDRLCHGK